jgi:hypothetical protein
MEALFCGFLVGARLAYHPLTTQANQVCTRGTRSAKTRGWSKTTRVFLAFQGPPATGEHLGRTKATPNPPTLQKTGGEMQKRRRRRQNALRRFLATLAMIGRNYAPDFSGANPQGVQWDSLESFRAVASR